MEPEESKSEDEPGKQPYVSGEYLTADVVEGLIKKHRRTKNLDDEIELREELDEISDRIHFENNIKLMGDKEKCKKIEYELQKNYGLSAMVSRGFR